MRKILPIIWMLLFLSGFVASICPEGLAYEKLVEEATKQKKEEKPGKVSLEKIILEVGVVPSPTPSRRQIIDADKGASCLVCHRMPYPTAPQKPTQSGQPALSSIEISPPSGWKLLTPLPYPFHKIAGSWSPDGKKFLYSMNLFQKDWDIWMGESDGSKRTPLLSGPTVDLAPDWSPDGKSIVFQS
ncbi:MAG: hypothetical protein QHH30_10455, partial [candidate division NC10 bacterium]|nr:hypothetical protein [candidate division NC10 bacterium]